jgi:hypothetical protein
VIMCNMVNKPDTNGERSGKQVSSKLKKECCISKIPANRDLLTDNFHLGFIDRRL